MAYTTWSVVFGEQPTAAKWNQLGQNDAGFKDGTNIDNAAIKKAHLEAGLNAFMDYSTSEVATKATWINGKTIYKKTIAFGALPNTASKSVAHGITGLERVMRIETEAYEASGSFYYNFGHVNTASLANGISMYADATNVSIVTGSNRTGVSANITLYYTKT